MGVKAFFAKRFAAIAARKIQRWANDPLKTQQKVFAALIRGAKDTKFGRDHNIHHVIYKYLDHTCDLCFLRTAYPEYL